MIADRLTPRIVINDTEVSQFGESYVMELYRCLVSVHTVFLSKGGREVLNRGDLFGCVSKVIQDEAAVLISERRQEFVSPRARAERGVLRGHRFIRI